MNEFSARRRLAGRGLLAAALIALPMTASISYAASDMAAPPAPAAPSAPVPPAPPAAPSAPLPPLAPLAPVAFQSAPDVVVDVDVDVDEDTETVVSRHVIVDKDGKRKEIERRREVIIKDKHGKLSAQEREELRREIREELAEVDLEIAEAMEEARVAMLELRDSENGLTKISMNCKDGKSGEFTDDKGRTTVLLCTSEIMASALNGLKEARKAIAQDKNMSGEIRAEVLRSLDEQIKRWHEKEG